MPGADYGDFVRIGHEAESGVTLVFLVEGGEGSGGDEVPSTMPQRMPQVDGRAATLSSF